MLTERAITLTTPDHEDLHVRVWMPQTPRSLAIVTHGLGEHGGRHAQLAEFLCGRGSLVYVMDLRGHGLSSGHRGHTPSFRSMLGDIDLAIDHGQAESGPLTCLVLGHSLGGALALGYGLWGARPVSGVVATAPWLRLTREQPWWKAALARLVSPILPHYTVATAVDRDYPDAESAILGEQELDPLNHRRISGRLYLSFLDTGRSLIQQAGRLRCEALVVHGSLDDVTDVSASIEFAARAEGKCELDVWPGVYHELNREHRQRLHDRIGDWLSALPVDGRDRRTFNETL